MLEQRRAIQKGYITLKEAAELTGYTPDYVSQLVRAGKIKGEQVYSGFAWVTTPDEVYSYLSDKNRVTSKTDTVLFFESSFFKYALYMLIGFCCLCLLLLQYIFYISIDSHLEKRLMSTHSIIVEEFESS